MTAQEKQIRIFWWCWRYHLQQVIIEDQITAHPKNLDQCQLILIFKLMLILSIGKMPRHWNHSHILARILSKDGFRKWQLLATKFMQSGGCSKIWMLSCWGVEHSSTLASLKLKWTVCMCLYSHITVRLQTFSPMAEQLIDVCTILTLLPA